MVVLVAADGRRRGDAGWSFQGLRGTLADGLEDVAGHVGRGAVVLVLGSQPVESVDRGVAALHEHGRGLRPAADYVAHALAVFRREAHCRDVGAAQAADGRREGLEVDARRLLGRRDEGTMGLVLLVVGVGLEARSGVHVADHVSRGPCGARQLPATEEPGYVLGVQWCVGGFVVVGALEVERRARVSFRWVARCWCRVRVCKLYV